MDARMSSGLLGGLKRKLLAGGSFFLTSFKSSVAAARDREDVKRDLGDTFGALGDLIGGDS